MVERVKPRFVLDKPLASGATAFYFTVPTYYRKLGCTIPNEPLGTDYEAACGEDGTGGRAASLNETFNEWNQKRLGQVVMSGALFRYGTVDWLFREYKSSKAYLEKVAPRSRPDYERTMLLIADALTKKGDRIGSRPVRTITPRGADKIYEKIIIGAKGKRLRQGEKAVALCHTHPIMIPDPRSGSGRRDEPIAEFDVLPPNGRWFRFRVPTRSERFWGAVGLAALIALSLLLWALPFLRFLI